MKSFAKFMAYVLTIVPAALIALLFVRLRAPLGFMLWGFKLTANAFAPLLAFLGWAGAVLAMVTGAPLAALAGLFAAVAGVRFTLRAVREDDSCLNRTLGKSWREHIPLEVEPRMLPTRHGPLPNFAAYTPKPMLERDVVYHRLPNGRKLLCDVWTPPAGRPHTGTAIIFAHGSAWTILDKDFGTRPFFRHLAGQGHVIIDIAYRLYPEVQIPEMLHDFQHAIAWTKNNATQLRIDPQRVVLGGASAGGHLALLAAYAPNDTRLLAPDLNGNGSAEAGASLGLTPDLGVRAVFSYYGPADLAACYAHTNQGQIPARAAAAQREAEPWLLESSFADQSPIHNLAWFMAEMGKAGNGAGSFVDLLGCSPAQDPDRYALYSPITHAGAGSPPTFLAQGSDDLISPTAAIRALEEKLCGAGVPVISRVFPQTDHGFDLLAPTIAPASLSALYDLERFLAVVG